MPIQNKRKNKKRISFLSALIYIIIFSIIIISAISIYMIKSIIETAPDITPKKITLQQNAQILDSKGKLLEKIYYDGYRTVIGYKDISKDVLNAFVAIEDKTFWEHNGFNYVRLVGAVKDSITSGGRVGGTSTLSQQLARNLYLTDERSKRTISRKVKEAYYAMKIEDTLNKEEIITAYLNTVYLGASANGIEAAANIYFSKSAKDLDYIEAAMLATTPAAPSYYQPMYIGYRNEVKEDKKIVAGLNSQYVYVYNPSFIDRYKLVLKLMHEQGYISKEQLDKGLKADLYKKLKPGNKSEIHVSSYFGNYIKKQVVKDLSKKYKISKKEAENMFLTNGLTIHSTLDTDMQNKVDNNIDDSYLPLYFGKTASGALKEYQRYNKLSATGEMNEETWNSLIKKGYFDKNVEKTKIKTGDTHDRVFEIKKAVLNEGYAARQSYLPTVVIRTDSSANLIDDSSNIILYNYHNYFDEGNKSPFKIPASLVSKTDDGNVIVKTNNIVGYYISDKKNVQATIKNMYTKPGNGKGRLELHYFFIRRGGSIKIDSKYLKINNDKNLVIDSKAFDGKLIKLNSDNSISINSEAYSISNTPIVQPQLAFTIIDYKNGYIKSMVGGQQVYGSSIINRADVPHQIGSSIKPIAVYAPAIDSKKFNAASVIKDTPLRLNGRIWPYNYDRAFRGNVDIRRSIKQSLNVPAVRVGMELGVSTMYDYLTKNGISTLVDEGDNNDMNYAALCLGGLTYGMKNVEVASAYGTLGNMGIHIPPTSYTKVVDYQGKVILDKTKQKGERVFKEGTSYIILDMMKDVVSRSFGRDARIRYGNRGIPVSGKTGTTNDNVDFNFSGLTPYYVGTVWIGADINSINLTGFSSCATKLYSNVMTDIHKGYDNADWKMPSDVVRLRYDRMTGSIATSASYLYNFGKNVSSELFLRDATPKRTSSNIYKKLEICSDTKDIANKYCPNTKMISILARDNNDKNTCSKHKEKEKKKEKPKEKPAKKPKKKTTITTTPSNSNENSTTTNENNNSNTNENQGN